MKNILDGLAIKYRTDKSSHRHGYTEMYDPIFYPIRHEP